MFLSKTGNKASLFFFWEGGGGGLASILLLNNSLYSRANASTKRPAISATMNI